MLKNSIKIIAIFMLIFLFNITPVFATHAEGTGGPPGPSIVTPGSVKPSADGNSQNDIKRIGGKIVGTLQSVGTIVSVIILVVLGIKYMIGSAEERAEYKKTMMPYLIGAILIFASVTIANMVYTFASSLK